jgi:hypothetical protein
MGNFRLDNSRPRSQTTVAMKMLSIRFRFIVLGVIVVAAVVSCCNYAFVVPGTIVPGTESFAFVDIGTKQRVPGYVEWKSKAQFDAALKRVSGHHGMYCLCVLKDANSAPIYPYNPYDPAASAHCQGYDCPAGKIRTVKVTKSKAADNIAAGGSALNDPHITYRVQSPDPGDISKVLEALKP